VPVQHEWPAIIKFTAEISLKYHNISTLTQNLQYINLNTKLTIYQP